MAESEKKVLGPLLTYFENQTMGGGNLTLSARVLLVGGYVTEAKMYLVKLKTPIGETKERRGPFQRRALGRVTPILGIEDNLCEVTPGTLLHSMLMLRLGNVVACPSGSLQYVRSLCDLDYLLDFLAGDASSEEIEKP